MQLENQPENHPETGQDPTALGAAPGPVIEDLTPELEPLYFACLEDWSQEMADAGDHKARWYEKQRRNGLRVKIARAADRTPAGMIQYLPIEHSFAEGHDLEMILCVWVHGHKQGPGNHQGHGLGQALLKAAEQDAKARGVAGMAAWGILVPAWMRAKWFRKQGYRKADRDGIRVLMWKPFTAEARPPRWIRAAKKPSSIPGQVEVTCFMNGWCPAQNIVYERARRAVENTRGPVSFRGIDTSNRDTLREWGISDALFIDGRGVRTGPPPSYEAIKKRVEKRVARVKR